MIFVDSLFPKHIHRYVLLTSQPIGTLAPGLAEAWFDSGILSRIFFLGHLGQAGVR